MLLLTSCCRCVYYTRYFKSKKSLSHIFEKNVLISNDRHTDKKKERRKEGGESHGELFSLSQSVLFTSSPPFTVCFFPVFWVFSCVSFILRVCSERGVDCACVKVQLMPTDAIRTDVFVSFVRECECVRASAREYVLMCL